MENPDFYLTSSEGYGLEEVRQCFRKRRLGGRTADDYLLVRVKPPIIGQRFGLGDRDLDEVVLATRHEGQSLFPVSEWPLYVHVARPVVDMGDRTTITTREIALIGWAEIYPTEEQALAHRP